MGQWISRFFLLALLGFTLWFIGLLWFTSQVPQLSTHYRKPVQSAPYAVALTGGQGRITYALELLAAGKTQRLFISGVHPDISAMDLFSAISPRALKLYRQYRGHIVIGRVARSTRGNAVEIAAHFAGMQDPPSKVLLVTTNYHMPRSLRELERLMPQINWLAEPVFSPRFNEHWWQSPQSLWLLLSEYHKTIVSTAIFWGYAPF